MDRDIGLSIMPGLSTIMNEFVAVPERTCFAEESPEDGYMSIVSYMFMLRVRKCYEHLYCTGRLDGYPTNRHCVPTL